MSSPAYLLLHLISCISSFACLLSLSNKMVSFWDGDDSAILRRAIGIADQRVFWVALCHGDLRIPVGGVATCRLPRWCPSFRCRAGCAG